LQLCTVPSRQIGTWVSERFFQEGVSDEFSRVVQNIFAGGGQMWWNFIYPLGAKKTTFLLKIRWENVKYQNPAAIDTFLRISYGCLNTKCTNGFMIRNFKTLKVGKTKATTRKSYELSSPPTSLVLRPIPLHPSLNYKVYSQLSPLKMLGFRNLFTVFFIDETTKRNMHHLMWCAGLLIFTS